MPRGDLIQVRKGTAAEWSAANPVLAAGELGLETDTGKIKGGNGTSAWSSLPYSGSGGGGGGGHSWGSITGTLSSQTDLQTALNGKASASDLASGLAGKADAGAVTAALADKADTSALTSGLATKADTSTVNAALDLKLNASKITVGTTAPVSPSVGDLWVDTN